MRMKALASATSLGVALIVGSGLQASTQQQTQDGSAYSPTLASINAALRAAGVTDRAVYKAELLIAKKGYKNQATTLIASDRTHLTSSQFVENDPRREWTMAANTMTYLVDQSQGAALSWATVPGGAIVVLPNVVTEPEIDTSMDVWAAMPCNGPAIQKVGDTGADPDFVDNIVAGQPRPDSENPFADITHAGWLPAGFFNAIAQDGANFILGVTFTFVFIDDAGNATDIDGDHRADSAFAEIYYNQSFPWGTGGNESNVDIQSVVIHEAGHALGLAHFGKVFIKNNGTLQFAPKAIMNAVYVSEDRRVLGTDNASFCQAWARSH
jgi:hypothetical protein